MQDNIETWIQSLRERTMQPTYTQVGLVDFGQGYSSLPLDLLIRIMLADLASCDEPPVGIGGKARDEARRHALLAEFHRLRNLLT
jgi:hypothetical protein